MPNKIRRPRSRQPERRHNRACTPGTHLTDEERRHIYNLQTQMCSQRVIATTLQLPRTTVQSAIHAMSGRRRMQQNSTQALITPAPDSAPAAVSSSSTSHTLKEGEQSRTTFQHSRSLHITSTTPLVPPVVTSAAADRHSQPLQPAITAHHWRDYQLNSRLSGFSNLQRFNAPQGAFEISLPPCPPKLPPMEPRAIYGNS